MSDLPGGAKIPVPFKAGQPLTATELNEMQKALMLLLLTHDHSGNEQDAPQGVNVGSNAIANNAIKGQHISVNAVAKGDIHNGAVGASEIAEKSVASNHLVDGAIGTPQIQEKAVTMAKLADEVVALLNTPREGATTYAYAAYLDGVIAYPGTATWFDWLVEPEMPVRFHDLPIRRLRDDGGWQPIRTILPPEQIRNIIPNVDMTTRAEMAGSLASIFKQNESLVRDLVGNPITEVKTEGSQWTVTLGDGQMRILADTEMKELLGRLGSAGADLSRMSNPLRTSSTMNMLSAFERLASDASSLKMMAAQPGMDSLTGQPMAVRAPSQPYQPIYQPPPAMVKAGSINMANFRVPIDPALFLDPNPSDDLKERGRVALLIDPQTVDWQIPQEGATFFQPGVGGNAAFTDNGQAITFDRNRRPSKEEMVVVDRILHHFAIEDDDRINPEILLALPKFIDFLNNPQLLAAGYWTGAARNIRGVVRTRYQNRDIVRVRFATPYTNASYVVSVTPDFKVNDESFIPISAHVLRRRADYVDLLFLRGDVPYSKLSFSIAIHGELVQS